MGGWVLTSERQPAERGYYHVATAKKVQPKKYFWNGAYWVTPGHSPTSAVYSWFDEEVKNDADS